MARGGARPGAGRPARKSANTSPPSTRARARARVGSENQRPWPADKVERWAIDRLIPYAKNARTHTDAQVAAIAASIKEWGWTTPALGGCQATISSSIGVDLLIPEKPTLATARWWPAWRVASPLRNGIQGRLRWRSGRSRGSSVAWCPPLRRQTRRLEVVRRALPRKVPALVPRRVGGLLRLDLLQHGRQPLIVDDRARLHCLDLVEHLETEHRPVELNRKPPRPGS